MWPLDSFWALFLLKMFGLGGLNPKKMEALMSKMGISQEGIDASKVTIETQKGEIVINNPSVTKMNIKGNDIFQISGDVQASESVEISEQDIKTVMEKTGVDEQIAKSTLEKTKDLADAIMELSS